MIMKTFRVLVLTDHARHTRDNSLYALVSRMRLHDACDRVDVASRANPQNQRFFNNLETTLVEVISVKEDIEYDASGAQFNKNTTTVDLLDYDIIFLRLPHPVTDSFLIHLSDIADDKVMINDPMGIIMSSSKAILLNFPDLCPPMKLCKSVSDITDFSTHQDIVLKPLRQYGGKGLIKISGQIVNDDERDWPLEEYMPRIQGILESQGYLAMKFLKNVTNGDKRTIVVNGDILAASNRLPPQDSWLCNVARGGTSVVAEPTEEERNIVNKINPLLSENGILIYGVDTIEDDDGMRVLSEINTLSIGGFPHAEVQTGRPIIQMTLDRIFQYANQQNGSQY